MKNELHARLWSAQQRWFALKEQGLTIMSTSRLCRPATLDIDHPTGTPVDSLPTRYVTLGTRLAARQDRSFPTADPPATCGRIHQVDLITKHDLKMQGIRERGDMFYATRGIIFMGATRLAYEQELKRFLDYAHTARGRTENDQIDKKDFRAYMDARMAQGGAKSEMNKIRAAIVKFGALYGKWESFHALSKKVGATIRELSRAGQLRGPARPHVTPEVRQAVIERLRRLDALAEARTGPRGYALALELQKEASLRSIEATDRFTRQSLLGLEGDRGKISILGKGGRVRTAFISADLYRRLEAHFSRSKTEALAPRRAYQVALRRATLAVGGKATGSHAQRRTSAVEEKNARYRDHLRDGKTTKKARQLAVQDTVEHLGHSRNRKDLAAAYLRA